MNTYSLIVTIFTFVMVTIISTHKNSSINSDDGLLNTASYSDIVTISSILNNQDEFDLFDDDFSGTSVLHRHIANNHNPEKQLADNLSRNIFQVADKSTTKPTTKQVSNHRLAFYKQLNSRNNARKSKQVISSSDLEKENSVAEITFIFNKPTEVAPALITVTDVTDATNDSKKSIKLKKESSETLSKVANVDYWDTVHSIESKQGKLMYRPKNKSRSCTYTTSPCGHHQLTVQALKDIGCKTIQCRKDRLNYSKSLAMSKKLLAKNEKRLKKNGYQDLEDYQRYLIHQQGASGIKVILAATEGKKLLNKTIKKNMANNSPYSYRELSRMGSRLAANIFLSHWKNKWEQEKKLVAGISLASNDKTKGDGRSSDQISVEPFSLPLFNENEIQLALNFKF